MDEAALRGLITLGEGETIEFKKSLGEEKEALRTLAAFASQGGGTVVFGVSPQGRLVGVTVGANTLEILANAVASTIEPRVFPSIVETMVEGKRVVTVTIKSDGRPYAADGRFYRRVGRVTHPAPLEEYVRQLLPFRPDLLPGAAVKAAAEAGAETVKAARPDIHLSLEVDGGTYTDGGVPLVLISLVAINRGEPCDYFTFEMRLPFILPEWWRMPQLATLLQPRIGTDPSPEYWKPFIDPATGQVGVRFISPPIPRWLRGTRHILCQFALPSVWYGLKPASEGFIPLRSDIAPVKMVYSCVYALEVAPDVNVNGAINFEFYELRRGLPSADSTSS